MKKRKIFFALLITSIIFLVFLFPLTRKAKGSTNHTYFKVTVYPGDTLWDIAKEYCGDNKDIRKKIYEIKKANKLDSAVLIPGQQLIIP